MIPLNLTEAGQPVGFPVPDWRPTPHPSRESMAGRFCKLEALDPERHARPLWEANCLETEGRMWTYLPYGPFDSFESYRAFMQERWMGDDPLFYAIIDLKSDRPVGLAAYLRIDRPNGVVEVGHLAFSPLLQRTPAATEAMYLMMARAFALGYRRYEWKCDALNAPSRVAAERLGFKFEGIFRQHVVAKGRNRDTSWYAIIDSEWPDLKIGFERWLDPENFDSAGQQRQRLAELRFAKAPPAGFQA